MQPLSAATVWVVGAVLMVTAARVCATEYHVAMNGSDANPGTRDKPLRTIGGAARRAQAGDTITVHAGTYRERVTPPRGGESDSRRIVYQAAPGEEVWIKGSEIARGWEKYRGTVWLLKLPKGYFATYNPYTDEIEGDWFTSKGRVHHTGEVYVNGKALVEAARLEEVLNPQADAEAREPEATRYRWNLVWDNTSDDLFVEVNHGPFVVDNNIFLSAMSVRDWSEGGAWAHNYFGGLISSRPELNRWTPYHLAHSTAVTGIHVRVVAALRDYYGLAKQPVKVIEPYQMLGLVEEDLKRAMGIDVEGGVPAEQAVWFSE